MIQPDWTILVSAAVFLLTVVALNALLFKPLQEVVEQRKAATVGLRERAQDVMQRFEALVQEYENKTRQEKQKGYKLAEEARREALKERAKLVAAAREKGDAVRSEARRELEADLDSSRQLLKNEAVEISKLITSRILQRSA